MLLILEGMITGTIGFASETGPHPRLVPTLLPLTKDHTRADVEKYQVIELFLIGDQTILRDHRGSPITYPWKLNRKDKQIVLLRVNVEEPEKLTLQNLHKALQKLQNGIESHNDVFISVVFDDVKFSK